MSCPRDAKLAKVTEAIALIRDGQTIATGGFIGSAHPEALTRSLEEHFWRQDRPGILPRSCRRPRGWQVQGHQSPCPPWLGKARHRRALGFGPSHGKAGSCGRDRSLQHSAGVLCQLFRDIAAKRPGCITHVGLDTFIDPLLQGGKLNSKTTEDLVERVSLGARIGFGTRRFPFMWG